MRRANSAAAGVEVRRLSALEEFEGCVEVEKRVWSSADIDVVPAPIFVVTAETGGQVLGAFDGAKMIGFTLAFPAFRPAPAGLQRFLHSHMTAVLPEYQNRGVGRRLKLFQREDALGRGIELVEWTFDPLEVRNAYFNVVRLGAIVRRYIPNCYGITTSPLHAGLPTDRLVAEWWLRSPRVAECVAKGATPAPVSSGEGAPARIDIAANLAELRKSDPAQAARVQAQVREQFQKCFARNYVVTGMEVQSGAGPARDASAGSYLLEPYEGAQAPGA